MKHTHTHRNVWNRNILGNNGTDSQSLLFAYFLLFFFIRSFGHYASFAVRFKNKQTDYVALFLIRIDIQDTGHVDIERKETECYDQRRWKKVKSTRIIRREMQETFADMNWDLINCSLSLSPVLKWVSQSCASQLKLGYWPKTTAKIARSYYIQWVDETWLARQRALNPLRCCLRRPLFRRWIMFITSVGSHMRLMTVSSMATQMVNRSVFAWINWETLFRPAECWLPELGHSHRFCGFSCRFFTSCNVERFGLLWLSSLQGQWSQKLESQQGRVLAHSCPDGHWFSRVSELVASFYLIEKKEGDGRQQQFGKAHGRSSAIKAGFLSTPQMELWRTVDTFRTRRRIHQYPAALFYWHYNCCYQKLRQGRFYCHVTHGRIYSCLCYVNTKNFCC